MSLLDDARSFALHEISLHWLPNLELFLLSEKKIIELARFLHADEDLALIGHSLMDCKLWEAFSLWKIGDHVAMWISFAKQFLTQYDLDSSYLDNLLNCIAAHHWTIPYTCIESEICANADCYRFIHPRWFFGNLLSCGKRGLSLDDWLMLASDKLEEKWGVVSLDVCKKELAQYHATFRNYLDVSLSYC